MAKTLTPLQEQLVATVLAGRGSGLHLEKGEVNSANNLEKRGLLRPGYTFSHTRFTQELTDAFWNENDLSFAIEGLHHTGWLVFHRRELMAKCSTKDKARTVAIALKETARLGGC